MDDKEKQDEEQAEEIFKFFKKPYLLATIAITIIVIIVMSLTQSYWMDIGINILYNEEKFSNINNASGIYILSGQYSEGWLYHGSQEKAYIVKTNATNCEIREGYVRLLVTTDREYGRMIMTDTFGTNDTVSRVMVFKVLEGCKE